MFRNTLFRNTNNRRKQNEGKLLEWIQQNRKKTAEEVSISTVKLPYYGKYCGSFVGQVSCVKIYEIYIFVLIR